MSVFLSEALERRTEGRACEHRDTVIVDSVWQSQPHTNWWKCVCVRVCRTWLMSAGGRLIESSPLERWDLNSQWRLAPPPPLSPSSCAVSVDAHHHHLSPSGRVSSPAGARICFSTAYYSFCIIPLPDCWVWCCYRIQRGVVAVTWMDSTLQDSEESFRRN